MHLGHTCWQYLADGACFWDSTVGRRGGGGGGLSSWYKVKEGRIVPVHFLPSISTLCVGSLYWCVCVCMCVLGGGGGG